MDTENQLIEVRINEASTLLKSLGLPEKQTNKMAALVFLALAGQKVDYQWDMSSNYMYTNREIMDFISDEYKVDYAANTRETIRRHALHQFEQACLVSRNFDDPCRPTNSPLNNYKLTSDAFSIALSLGCKEAESKILIFKESIGTLKDEYQKKLDLVKVDVTLPGGKKIKLSPGEHNDLHKAIVEGFLSRFGGKKPEVLYIGDTGSSRNEGGKMLHLETDSLNKIGIPTLSHEKLPDVVAVDHAKKWVFLIEAVTSHGPVSPKRLKELNEMLEDCSYGTIFVTAFPDLKRFKKYSSEIAWETEVWIKDLPEHMIHFNGDRFIGPRN